jgi:hypothetical protein
MQYYNKKVYPMPLLNKLLRKKNRIISYGNFQYKVEFSSKPNHMVDVSGRALPRVSSLKERKRIAVVGGGWYGVHIACELQRKHPAWDITLFEKNTKIFSGVSGMFGIRLHAGPHYPRSKKTRDDCHKSFSEFYTRYPKIITQNGYSIYGLAGINDADGNPSKVTKEEFAAVCAEFGNAKPIQAEQWGFRGLASAYNLEEPSVQVGRPLRRFFKEELKRSGVKLKCNAMVSRIKKMDKGIAISYSRGFKRAQAIFDHIINATNYQSLSSVSSTDKIEVVHQVCIALAYKHKVKPLPADPFSFIVMDGWYPCIMPYDDRMDKSKPVSKYILTHGKWTIMATFKTSEEAQQYLAKLNDEFIAQEVKPKCEAEVQRFYPAFCEEFKYIGWKGTVLAKSKTSSEFRSAVTLLHEANQEIKILPGKISNVFAAEQDVSNLLEGAAIITQDNVSYPKDSVFACAQTELAEKPKLPLQSTTGLQSFPDIPTIKKPAFFCCLGAEEQDVGYIEKPLIDKSNNNQVKNSVLTPVQAELAETVKASSHATTARQSVSAFFSAVTKKPTKGFLNLFNYRGSADSDISRSCGI